MHLSEIPIVDTHAHAFYPDKEQDDFRVYFNLGLFTPPLERVKNTLVNKKIIHELCKVLDLPPDSSEEDVVKYRNKVYKIDPKAYIQKLIQPFNIERIIIDSGFPHEYYTGYNVDLNFFSSLFSTQIFSSYRMDNCLNKILEDQTSNFEKALQAMDDDFKFALKKQKTVAVKTLIAYQTGLDINKVTKMEAAVAFKNFKTKPCEKDEKIIRDYFFTDFIKKCIELDIPIQVHTGYGSPPLLNLFKSNPMLLQNILAEDEFKSLKIILVHAGYPFSKEAGFMTSVFQNCYVDISVIPYYGIGYKTVLLDLFELAPFNRILFASDGALIPETYWFGYLNGIKTLEEVLTDLVQNSWISKKEQFEFAEMILNKNANTLFNF